MNLKLIVGGALAYFVVTMIIGMGVSGPIIHEGFLEPAYDANEAFWRPELRTDPPDMAALMPMWITKGLISALVIAALYGWLSPAMGTGPGWQKGMKFGLLVSVFGAIFMLDWSGVFDLPDNIWMWWGVDSLLANIPGGAALGWVGQKLG